MTARKPKLLKMGAITYDRALVIILGHHGGVARSLLLAYFHEDEHGAVGRALDAMVLRGAVAFDGTFYRLGPNNLP